MTTRPYNSSVSARAVGCIAADTAYSVSRWGRMQNPQVCSVSYRRSRFSTKLPGDRLYTPSHFWMLETDSGIWRVGVTRFAQRMLGDLVEHGFEIKPDAQVELGETIGWIEAFKAMTDVYCVGTGQFDGGNPLLEIEPHKFDSDPYSAGWLYSFRGTPDPNAVDAAGYSRLLDLAIDKIQGKEAAMDRPPTDDIGD